MAKKPYLNELPESRRKEIGDIVRRMREDNNNLCQSVNGVRSSYEAYQILKNYAEGASIGALCDHIQNPNMEYVKNVLKSVGFTDKELR